MVFVYVPMPEKYFTPGSSLSLQSERSSSVMESGAPRPGWNVTFHGPSTVVSWVFVASGMRARDFGCRLAEHHEDRAPGLEVQRHRGAAVGHLERRGLRGAGLGVPQLRLLAGHAERGVDRLGVIAAVVHEVEIAARELAVHELHVGSLPFVV